MRRRDVLRTGAGALALPVVGSAAHASQGASYAPISRLGIPGIKEVVVSDDGTTAYAALTDGFATIDISDPGAPVVLHEERNLLTDRENGPLTQIFDVKVDGDTLVVAGPAQSGSLKAFVVYDVSDPSAPDKRAVQETPTTIHNCDVSDGHVYITGINRSDNPLIAYDITGEFVEEVGRWSPLDADREWGTVPWFPRVLHDLYVEDGVAYCAYWDAGTFIVDVSDPSSPEYVSRVGEFSIQDLAEMSYSDLADEYTEGPEGNAHYTTVNDDASLLAVGTEAWDVAETPDGGPGGIDLYDVSDPTTPEHLAYIPPEEAPDMTRQGTETTAHNLELRGDRLYSSWYQAGVKLHDVSDPANPELLAWWLEPSEYSFWTAQAAVPGEFFVASSFSLPNLPFTEELVVFPDRPGEQANRPSLMPSEDGTTSATSTTAATTTPTLSVERTTEASPSTTEPTESDESTERAPGETPGFGVLAAVGALGVGALRTLGPGTDE